ncbi:unnamed protein product [Caretta caretta]
MNYEGEGYSENTCIVKTDYLSNEGKLRQRIQTEAVDGFEARQESRGRLLWKCWHHSRHHPEDSHPRDLPLHPGCGTNFEHTHHLDPRVPGEALEQEHYFPL